MLWVGKYACLKRKITDIRARVDAPGEADGAMSWALQEDAMTWLERNHASTDGEAVKAMVDEQSRLEALRCQAGGHREECGREEGAFRMRRRTRRSRGSELIRESWLILTALSHQCPMPFRK